MWSWLLHSVRLIIAEKNIKSGLLSVNVNERPASQIQIVYGLLVAQLCDCLDDEMLSAVNKFSWTCYSHKHGIQIDNFESKSYQLLENSSN